MSSEETVCRSFLFVPSERNIFGSEHKCH